MGNKTRTRVMVVLIPIVWALYANGCGQSSGTLSDEYHVLVKKAIDFGNKGDYDKAIDYMNKAIALHPKHTNGYMNRALIYYWKKDVDNQIADYGRIIALAKENGEKGTLYQTYCQRGYAYNEKREFTKAIADFKVALKENTKELSAYLGIAEVYRNVHQYDDALSYSEQAMQLDSNNSAVRALLGQIYEDRGTQLNSKSDLTQAVAHYSESDRLSPGSEEVEAGLKRTVAKLGRLSSSVARPTSKPRVEAETTTVSVTTAPAPVSKAESEDFHITKAKAFLVNHQEDLAIAEFDKVIDRDPRNAEAYYWRGCVHLAKSNYDGAKSDLDQAIRLEPNKAY